MIEDIRVFNSTNEIDKKNWKTSIKLKYWLSCFIDNFHQQGKIMEPPKQFHVQKGGTEIIPS